jgi:hypothetical protein
MKHPSEEFVSVLYKDLKKLKIKNGKETAKDRRTWG